MEQAIPDVMAAVIGGVSRGMAQVGDAERGPWLFARCLLAESRFQLIGRDPAALEGAIADLFALPRDFPGRPRLAAALVEAMFHARRFDDSAWVDQMVRLADIAKTDPNLPPAWAKRDATVRATALQLGAKVSEGLGRLRPDADGPAADQGALIRMIGDVIGRIQRGDMAGAMELLADLRKRVAALDSDDPRRVSFEQAEQTLLPFASMLQPGSGFAEVDSDVAASPQDALRRLRSLAELPGLSGPERATRLMALATATQTVDTRPALDEAAAYAQQALDLSPDHDPRRPYYLMSAATIHLRRAEMSGNREHADIAAGTALLEQARELAGSSTHTLWTMASNPLAHAYRLSGRNELSRRTALSGLRGHAWSVLLQSNIADVHAAARHAASDALDVARWCLTDNDPEGAATALELGRGLILFAAGENRDVEKRLIELGQGRLAGKWRQAQELAPAHEVPARLRQEVASVLAGVPLAPDGTPLRTPAEAAARLLEPPSMHEIRAALGALGMDALVYLVPGDTTNGAAVVIPVGDEPGWALLPSLNQQSFTEFERFIVECGRSAMRSGGQRDAFPEAELGPGSISSAVDEVCDWAWQAAIGPLLESHLDAPSDRPVRIVLVPVRELSRVPWHAARFRDANGHTHHALERAVFSYAASARMFCESAWRRDVPVGNAGLIVSDPDAAGRGRALPAARSAAHAIKDAFYPSARYVGRQPDGSQAPDGGGSPEQIRGWLADPHGGAMIHLACHALVRTGIGPDETSYLLLAQGRRLSTEDLLNALSTSEERELSLAVLAACNSAESGRGYDEAFSLATGFLAHNTNSVISAQWSVPDSETSVLMYMFHHYLRGQGLRPVDALRQAQLWMLTDRTPPAAMPAELHQHLTNNPAPSTASWAAFIHTGR
jgi:CHAT domain-containing protein